MWHALVENIAKGYHPKLNIYRNIERKMFSEEDEIMERWSEVFKETLNKPETLKGNNRESLLYRWPADGTTLNRRHHKPKMSIRNCKAPAEESVTPELM